MPGIGHILAERLSSSANIIHEGSIRCGKKSVLEALLIQSITATCFARVPRRKRLAPKTVVIFPTGSPAHRAGQTDLAQAAHRLEMCRLAVAGIHGFEVDDRECRRPGPTYTIDTARELKKDGWTEVTWLIGADMLNTLPTWHEADALLQEVRFHRHGPAGDGCSPGIASAGGSSIRRKMWCKFRKSISAEPKSAAG